MHVRAWHFLTVDEAAAANAARHPIARVEGPPRFSDHGLQASRHVLDALTYACGPVACRVRVGGMILRGADRLIGTERTVLAMADCSETLHRFACWCAHVALDVEGVTDVRCWEAIRTKIRWLEGRASDAELTAARDAVWDVAETASVIAARCAACALPLPASRDASRVVRDERIMSPRVQNRTLDRALREELHLRTRTLHHRHALGDLAHVV